jgi:hypothetical protein
MHRLLMVGLLLALTGCASAEWGRVEQSIESLMDQPLSLAMKHLGYPTSERHIAGKQLYIWERLSVSSVPVVANSWGTAAGPFGATTGYTSGISSRASLGHCKVILEVDSGGIVRGYQLEGNLLGCSGVL